MTISDDYRRPEVEVAMKFLVILADGWLWLAAWWAIQAGEPWLGAIILLFGIYYRRQL